MDPVTRRAVVLGLAAVAVSARTVGAHHRPGHERGKPTTTTTTTTSTTTSPQTDSYRDRW